ncbi:MAG: type I restriction enzyme HsdR N-terminal domain-containing protein [Bacteroidales bacterium]|nr:type I restriction enzyme HsdR N-terminal domain-containing protein [Bacteroidales bacterium]
MFNPEIRIDDNGRHEIFDPVRKQFVALTPEEHVRQFMIFFLHSQKNVPYSLMGVERQIRVNNLVKRPDIVVFSNSGNVEIIVECKAPKVEISTNTLDQIIRYNMALHAKYLILTNGDTCFCVCCNDGNPVIISVDDLVYKKNDINQTE